MMKSLACMLILAVVTLSGCVDEAPATDPEPPVDPTPSVPKGAALLHGPSGVPVNITPTVFSVGVSGHTGFSSFEPTIGVTSSGALFMSNSEGAIATGHSSIVRSLDDGATWQDVTPSIGGISTPPTSTDPYIFVDQITDRVYNLDMEGLNCNYIQWSDDDGESFTGHPLGCGQPPVLDHPSLFTAPSRTVPTVGYENVVYICVNRIADAACATSHDGGIVFNPFRPVFPNLSPEGGIPAAGCGGLSGHGIGGPDGRAYLGRIHCGVPMVAMSDDDGLTWTASVVSSTHTSSRHDVEVAVDAAGNVYALWADAGFDLYLAHSTDFGASWSEPINVQPPGINTTVFPAIAAGDAGNVAFVYLGNEVNQPAGSMPQDANWTAFIGLIYNATEPNPVIHSNIINRSGEPVASGPCDDDNRCGGIGDFIDIVIDMDGRPWAGLVDTYSGARGMVGTIREGAPLRGSESALPVLTSLDPIASEGTK